MDKLTVLNMIKELFENAVITKTADNDPSGYHTSYLVDNEQLMRNLDEKIQEARRDAEIEENLKVYNERYLGR